MEQGKLDEATRAYQSMMDQKPGLEAYTRAAHMRWLKGDLNGAIEVMQMAVDASSPRQPEIAAWVHVGLALYQLQARNILDASHLLEAALVLRPNYAPALAARGRLLLAEGNAKDAADSLRQAAQIHPLIETQWLLVEALRFTDQSEEAQGVERQVIERGPVEDPRTLALYLATTRQNVASAVRLAEKELETRQDVFTWDAIGWARRAAGQLEQAYIDSQRAVAQGTQDAQLFLHAGAIAAESGRREEAKRWLEQAAASQQMLLPSERQELERQLDSLRSHATLRTPKDPDRTAEASDDRSR
jgi:tetratricopeptide (TPR) repeat protein